MKEHFAEQEYGDLSRRLFERAVKEHRPVRASFEITYRCNIHCVHCYTDPFNTPSSVRQELPVGELVRILDEMAEAEVLWLTLTGGEALVHPHFERIYREAKTRGFLISIFTNATAVSDRLIEFLRRDPPFGIDVSLHGVTRETFERVTQVPGSYEGFMQGIRKIVASGLPGVRIKTKAMTINRHELAQIKSFVEGLGLKFNLYTPIYPRLNGDLSSTEYRLPADEIVGLDFRDKPDGEEDEERCADRESSSGHAGASREPSDDRLFRCGCGTNSITINPYGFLRACTFTTWPSYDLRTMSVKEAFGRLVSEIGQARYRGETPCRRCPVYTFCVKNPVAAEWEAGSMEAPVRYFCELAYAHAAKATSVEV
jgi:radical SAM protein with 4Fe4S-binding SPASM domain